eukprot:1774811-Amphidinium_carterae.1
MPCSGLSESLSIPHQAARGTLDDDLHDTISFKNIVQLVAHCFRLDEEWYGKGCVWRKPDISRQIHA